MEVGVACAIDLPSSPAFFQRFGGLGGVLGIRRNQPAQPVGCLLQSLGVVTLDCVTHCRHSVPNLMRKRADHLVQERRIPATDGK